MRAAVLEGPRRVCVRDVPTPAPGAGELLVRMQGAGICASELPSWEGREWFSYPLPPGNPGHEGWGVVEAVGEGVREPRPGTRVAMISYRAHAEYDIADARHAIALPASLDPEAPFPGEPAACAVNVFRRAGVHQHDRVAIVGAGFLGLLLVQLCVGAGASVTAVSRRASSREQALAFGADRAWTAEEASEEQPFDVVIEATGHEGPLELAARLTRIRGRLVIAGYHQDGCRCVDMQLWNWRGIDVINAHERDPDVYTSGLREAIDAVGAGRLRPATLVTHAYTLAQIADAFAVSAERPEGFVKAVWRDV